MNFKNILLLIFIIGCSTSNTINLSNHVFNIQPEKIIWIQVPGLDEDHLALLKFSMPSNQNRISFENMTCTGKMWSYNLYDLRPNPDLATLSEITGKKNVKGTCDDFKIEPIWNYLEKSGYHTAILESGIKESYSLDQEKKCAEVSRNFLSKTILWRMTEGQMESELFHFSESRQFSAGHIYYDKSCKKENCFSGLWNNSQSLFTQFVKNNNRYLYLIRDFSYFEALKEKKYTLAKDKLIEIDRVINYYLELAQFDNDMLVIVSTSSPLHLEFPIDGKGWAEFDKKGSQITAKNYNLTTDVFAKGARAENFCGIFEENQLFERMLISPKKQGLQLPFFSY